jgi:hypothetical protein
MIAWGPRNQGKTLTSRYLSNCLAMTMRWIWLVPS